MSWVCDNCSNSNDESSTSCAVCGYARPTGSRIRERESETVEGKIVFSDFAVIKETTKDFFKSIAKMFNKVFTKIKSSSEERSLRESREREEHSHEARAGERASRESERAPRETRVAREEAEAPRRERAFGERKDFAKPWPEHNIKFDIDVIKSKGFVRSEQTEMNGIKGYKFYKATGTGQFIKVDMLIVLRMAVKK